MIMRRVRLYVVFFLLFASFLYAQQSETILKISQRGYYSLQVESSTGAQITLIDRMAGNLAKSGKVGIRDGRIDIHLDAGEYKARLLQDARAEGTVRLNIVPFKEINRDSDSATLPQLPELELIQTSLGDLEQRSYWIYLPEDERDEQRLHIEIMGRNLSDCRLYRDGYWLEEITPSKKTFEPEPGKPMRHFEFYHHLKSGFYLLTCLGGRALAWTDDTNEYPLYVRRGVPYLGQDGTQTITVSPFGRDAFWVSGETNFFQLIRDDKKTTEMSVSSYSEVRSRFLGGRSARITEKSNDPWCMLKNKMGGEKQWLIVHALPGDQMELCFFVSRDTYKFTLTEQDQKEETKTYWISSLDSMDGRHTMDICPLLFDPESISVLKSQTLSVGVNRSLTRKINLFGEQIAYLQVEQGGTYRLLEDSAAGARGQYFFALFEDILNESIRSPVFQEANKPIELVSGLYFMFLRPEKKGILNFVLYKEDDASPRKAKAAARKTLENPPHTINSFIWPRVEIQLRKEKPLVLLANPRYHVNVGFIVRELPLSLSEPLPIRLNAGESVNMPVNIIEDSIFSITGSGSELRLNNLHLKSGQKIEPGLHTIVLTNQSSKTELYTLQILPAFIRSNIKKIQIHPPEESFDHITLDEPFYNDFEHQEKKHYFLQLKQPGLYRIETHGRLAMRLKVRTALKTKLFSAKQNHTGRNALITTYLKPGEYLISSETLGASAGRAGLSLLRTELIDAGILTLNAVSRKTLQADQALRYRLVIDEAGEYKIGSLGPGNKNYHYRIEDAHGWPLTSHPTSSGSLRIHLDPGTYYYYTLPEPIKTRRLTRIQHIPTTAEESIDEQPLTLNSSLKRTWRESKDRKPDIFRLDLCAPVKTRFFLTWGMEARIIRPDGELIYRRGGRESDLELDRGHYEFHVRSIDENDRFSYTINLNTGYLIPGLVQKISSAPAFIPVSLGEEQMVDIWSYGKSDVKAELRDACGNLVAANDDGENDWNFYISKKLKPGIYRLRVERVGVWSGTTSVLMESREELELESTALPFTGQQILGRSVLSVPFRTGSTDSLITLEGSGDASLFIALYRDKQLIAETHSALHIPLKADTRYTAHFWHQTDISIPFRIAIKAIEEKQQKRIILTNILHIDSLPMFSCLENRRHMSFYCSAENTHALYSSGIEQPCVPVSRYPLNTREGKGWLVSADSSPVGRVRIDPVELEAGSISTFMLKNLPHEFMLIHTENQPLLLEADSQGLVSGVTLLPADKYSRETANWAGMAESPSLTLTAIPGAGEYLGRMWKIIPGAGEDHAQRVTLRARSFKVQQSIKLPEDDTTELSVVIEAGSAIRVDLNRMDLKDQTLNLDLLLCRGLVAFAWKDGRPQSILAAAQENVSGTLSVSGGLLTVLNKTEEPGSFRILARSTDTDEPGITTIGGGIGFEQILNHAGKRRFTVAPAGKNRVLCVSGDNVTALLKSADGKYHYSEQVPARPYRILPAIRGQLEVQYQPGYLKVWTAPGDEIDKIDKIDEIDKSFFGKQTFAREYPLSWRPGSLINERQRWGFTLNETSFVLIDSYAAGVTVLYQDDSVLDIAAGGTGTGRSIFRCLKPGNYRVLTRPIKGSAQTGLLELTSVTPVDLDHKPSEKIYFSGAGSLQVFRFFVKKTGKVGVGLDAEKDMLKGRLYDKDFCLLGEGSLMFRQLDSGTYYLVIPGSRVPVRYRPLLLGLKGSLQDIPPEIIDQYQQYRAIGE